MKKMKVDEILGKPIYFDKKTGKFKVEIGEEEFESDTLDRLKLNVNESHITEHEEEIYYDSTGDLIKTKIVRITPHSIHLSRYRAGIGVHPYVRIDEVKGEIFPITEKNKKLFKKNQELRDKGWALIHKAGEVIKDMDNFSKDYFKNKMKTKE